MELSDKELLNFAIENGMIDANTIRKKIEMNERKKFIERHEHEIWQGKNGLWYTYLPDEQKRRKLIKRKTEEEIYDEIVKFYKSAENEPTIRMSFICGLTKNCDIMRSRNRHMIDMRLTFIDIL